jgi:FSR family fosmidomycin resistance protein-like MFS transporter
MSLNAFIPLVLINIVGVSDSFGSMGLSLYSAIGVFGTFCGGFVSDKFGHIKVILIASICICPLLFLFSVNKGLIIAIILILFIAFFQAAPHSTFVVMGQDYLHSRLGLASGIIYGVTVSVGGMASPLVGHIGDIYGLPYSIITLGIVAIVSLLLTIFLCYVDKHEK